MLCLAFGQTVFSHLSLLLSAPSPSHHWAQVLRSCLWAWAAGMGWCPEAAFYSWAGWSALPLGQGQVGQVGRLGIGQLVEVVPAATPV